MDGRAARGGQAEVRAHHNLCARREHPRRTWWREAREFKILRDARERFAAQVQRAFGSDDAVGTKPQRCHVRVCRLCPFSVCGVWFGLSIVAELRAQPGVRAGDLLEERCGVVAHSWGLLVRVILERCPSVCLTKLRRVELGIKTQHIHVMLPLREHDRRTLTSYNIGKGLRRVSTDSPDSGPPGGLRAVPGRSLAQYHACESWGHGPYRSHRVLKQAAADHCQVPMVQQATRSACAHGAHGALVRA